MKRHLNTAWRLIWSEARQQYVIASELTRGKGGPRLTILSVALAANLGHCLNAQAAVTSGMDVFNSTMQVSSGDIWINTTINNGGALNVFNGGTATSTTINSRGRQYVFSGGTATSTTVNSEGGQHVSSGGTTTSTTINSRGRQDVFSGGTATSTTVNGGRLYVLSGGTATSPNVIRGGLSVSSGAFVDSPMLSAGASLYTNTGATITSGINATGAFSISGNVARNVLLENAGALHVLSGGSATSTIINRAGFQFIDTGGSATSTIVNSGGWQRVSSGGTATSTTINGGRLYVLSGGTATSTNVIRGGLSVSNGAFVDSPMLSAGASLYTNTRTTITNGTNASGSFSISGNVARNVLLENNGMLTVLSDGNATSTIVNSAGVLVVQSGGVLTSTTHINNSGTLSGDPLNNGSLIFTVDSGNTNSYSGSLTGNGILTKEDAGTLTLGGILTQDQLNLNGGSLVMDGLTATTDIIANAGTALSLQNGTTLTGMIDPTDVSIDSGSVWNMTDNSLVDNLSLSGTINFTGSGNTLTMTSLNGSNGLVSLRETLNGDNTSGDHLVIDGGQVTGTTRLSVPNAATGAQTTGDGVLVVQGINGADTTAQTTKDGFVLASKVYGGAYEYFLTPGTASGSGQNWYLTTVQPVAQSFTWRPDVASLPARAAMMTGLMQQSLSVPWQSGLRWSADHALWATLDYSHRRLTDSSDVRAQWSGNMTSLQTGADLWSAGDDNRVGVYLAFGTASGDTRGALESDSRQTSNTGKTKGRSYSFGTYVSRQNDAGVYARAVGQLSLLRDADDQGADGHGWAVSGEFGREFALSDHFSLTPFARLGLSDAHYDRVKLSGNTTAKVEREGGPFNGGAGLRMTGTLKTSHDLTLRPYMEVSLTTGEDGRYSTRFQGSAAGTTVRSDFSQTMARVSTGAEVTLNGGSTVGLGVRYGQDVEGQHARDTGAELNVRVPF